MIQQQQTFQMTPYKYHQKVDNNQLIQEKSYQNTSSSLYIENNNNEQQHHDRKLNKSLSNLLRLYFDNQGIQLYIRMLGTISILILIIFGIFCIFFHIDLLINIKKIFYTNQRPYQYVCQQNNIINKISSNISLNYKVRSQFRLNTPVPLSWKNDFYDFSQSVDDLIQINKQFRGKQMLIEKQAFQQAIRLMEVNHNINIKGQYQFDHFNFYTCSDEKYLALKKVLQIQKQTYNKKYQIQKYRQDQIRFCVCIPSYNNAQMRLYLRNLDSIFQQDYHNYHIVYIDDVSTDGTGDYVDKYFKVNNIPEDKFTLVKNQQRRGGCYNINMCARKYCNLGEVMILIDGDDSLIGRQVFSLLNAVYQKQKVALTYGQHVFVQPNKIFIGYADQVSYQILDQGKYRSLRYTKMGHLKTLYVDLFRAMDQKDIQYKNGTFYHHATDAAFITPSAELAGTRVKFIRELIYEHRSQNGHNQDRSGQSQAQNQIYSKPVKKRLNSMPFADNPKTKHYEQKYV